MNTRLLIAVCLVFIYIPFIAQNLIPNPGFDSVINCPFKEGQIGYAVPWLSATSGGTPDLYNECGSVGYMVPHPFIYCYQPALSKGGYANIGVYGGREYIETPLSSPLEKGHQYYIHFFVSPDSDCLLGATWKYTDAIGLAFSDTLVRLNISDREVLPLEPAIENRGKVIRDTANWTRINGCYNARGGENYAIIGNFRTDAQTILEVEDINDIPHTNYMFIEDVMVIEFDPLPDTILLCEGEERMLNATFLDATYRWSTGETNPEISIKTGGNYIVEASIGNCILTDTVVVIDPKKVQDFPIDTTFCTGELLFLYAPIPGTYQWSDGSVLPYTKIEKPGNYSVYVQSDCGSFTFSTSVKEEDCSCNIFVPSAFSPNNDGNNDFLEIFFGCPSLIKINRFQVFDRWGNLLFSESNTEKIKWDGIFNGQLVGNGLYVWVIAYEYSKNGNIYNIIKSGNVSLLR